MAQAQDDISQESSQDSKNSKDAFFDPKPKPKMIRLLTVFAYVLSVSMAAICLSVYYIFMWQGEPHLGARRSIFVNHSEQERTIGLKITPLPHIHVGYPQRLISIDENNKTANTENETSTDVTDTTEMMVVDKENRTVEDMQRQLIALESETRLDESTTVSSEDNTTAWQEEYVDSPEDLSKSSLFLKKLFDKNDENY